MSIVSPTFKRLTVDELQGTPLQQTVEFTRPTVIERLMLHLFIEGTPTGTITARIKQGVTVASECTLNLTDILAQTGKTKTYYHGFVSFQFPKPPILKTGAYTIELAAGSYSFGSSWIGWVKLPSQPTHTDPVNYPHSFSVVEIRTA